MRNKNLAYGITLITIGIASKIVSNPFCGEILPVVITKGPDWSKALIYPFLTNSVQFEISLITFKTFSD